jgi:hypothetical protein
MDIYPGCRVIAYTFDFKSGKSTPVYGEYLGVAESGLQKILWLNSEKIEERTSSDLNMMRKNYMRKHKENN